MNERPSPAARMLAQAQRSVDAKKAWDDYHSGRDEMVRRTAKLKALRLAAESEKASQAPEPAKTAKPAARKRKPKVS